MKTLRNTIALLPLLTLAAACSDSDPAAIPAPVEGDFHVMMSVLPSGSTPTGSGSDAGTDAERAFDADHIYFATYDPSTWAVKDWLMDGSSSKMNSDVEAAYFNPTWGPSVAARLQKEDGNNKTGYKNGFAVGFFSVPANVKTSFTVNKALTTANAAEFVINWPATGSNPYWAPSAEKVGNVYNHIPMAGIVEVTAAEMQNYNPDVYTGVSPFQLPNVKPMRAMAKVVINDPEGLISKAEMKCPDKGYLLPDPAQLMALSTGDISTNIAAVKPRAVADNSPLIQTITPTEVKAGNQFVFYSYEQDFTGKKAGDDARKIITLYTDKILGADGKGTMLQISIAPYQNGVPDDDLMKANTDGSWQGLMRNRIYTYTVNSPGKVGLTITAKVDNWSKKVQTAVL